MQLSFFCFCSFVITLNTYFISLQVVRLLLISWTKIWVWCTHRWNISTAFCDLLVLLLQTQMIVSQIFTVSSIPKVPNPSKLSYHHYFHQIVFYKQKTILMTYKLILCYLLSMYILTLIPSNICLFLTICVDWCLLILHGNY